MNTAKTAIKRKRMSAPVNELFYSSASGIRETSGPILDYGCGHGKDVEELKEDFYKVVGYDPNFFPKRPKGKFDVVLMVYVINVIDSPRDRNAAIEDAWRYVRKGGQLVIVSRSESEILREQARALWKEKGYGFITHAGTYQRGYTPKQLDRLVCELLDGFKNIQYGRMDCGASMVIVLKE